MIKLYKFPIVVELSSVGHGVKNENRPMTQTDFSIQKGGLVSIDFVVRNNDRKPINLVGKKLVLVLMDRTTGKVQLRKRMKVIDPHKGRVIVNFDPRDLGDITPRHYRYSVVMTNEDGSQEFLYFDQKQAATRHLEVRNDAVPRVQDALVIDMTPTNLTPQGLGGFGDPFITRWYAGAYPASCGITTIAVYTTKFYGKLWVQGSIAEQPSDEDTEWYDLDLGTGHPYYQFVNTTGIESFNFSDKMKWIRFVVEPDDIQNGTIFQQLGGQRLEGEGRLTKILMRV